MSEYGEYKDKASEKGHRKAGPGGEQGNGASSGCMVVAPALGLALALFLLRRSRR